MVTVKIHRQVRLVVERVKLFLYETVRITQILVILYIKYLVFESAFNVKMPINTVYNG